MLSLPFSLRSSPVLLFLSQHWVHAAAGPVPTRVKRVECFAAARTFPLDPKDTVAVETFLRLHAELSPDRKGTEGWNRMSERWNALVVAHESVSASQTGLPPALKKTSPGQLISFSAQIRDNNHMAAGFNAAGVAHTDALKDLRSTHLAGGGAVAESRNPLARSTAPLPSVGGLPPGAMSERP